MTRPLLLLVLAAAAALAVAAIAWWRAEQRADPPADALGANHNVALRAQLERLNERVADLERRAGAAPAAAAPSAPPRTALESSDVSARVLDLERALARLQKERPAEESSLAAWSPPKDVSEGLHRVQGNWFGEARRRIVEYEQLLRQFPDDPGAVDVLISLINDCVTLAGPGRGQQAFDALTPHVCRELWQLDKVKASLADRLGEREASIATWQNVVASRQAPEIERARARLAIARTQFALEQYAAAQEAAQGIVNDYARSAAIGPQWDEAIWQIRADAKALLQAIERKQR
ncbi:MAG: hypothetical protein U1E76_03095 [Planctomycetota bacterium]